MAMSRSFGARSLTTRPPIEIVPALTSSRPAIIRSAVDLPHPDGPTSTISSWSLTSRLRCSMTETSPYRFATSVKVTPDMGEIVAEAGRPLAFILIDDSFAQAAAHRADSRPASAPPHPDDQELRHHDVVAGGDFRLDLDLQRGAPRAGGRVRPPVRQPGAAGERNDFAQGRCDQRRSG